MPDKRKGADKQTEEGQRAVRQVQQPLGNPRFITEDQIQRPEGDTQHNDHIRQRADLNVDLIGDNRHRDDQAVANQAAQRAQAQVPVLRALIAEVKRPQLRHPRTENQPQNRFKKLNQGEGIQKQALLKGDSPVAAIKPIAEHLANKQRQRQQEEIEDKRAGDGGREL